MSFLPRPACGESIGRLRRLFLRTPKQSFGYARSDRVRGTLRESNCHRPRGDSPSPQPSPRGEREKRSIPLHQRAATLVERTERLVAGHGGDELVEVPLALGLLGFLHL